MWTKEEFLRKIEVPQHEEEADLWKTSRWLNRDNVPLPPHRRTWGFWSYTSFWVTSGVNVSGWAGGASALSLGLTIGQAMAVTVASNIIIVGVLILTGQVGAHWHVGFPMWNRVVWGLRASYFPLVNRIILSFTWSATQGWLGAQCLKTFLGSMFPGIYTMKNTLPASTFMTNADFMCFMIFTAISIPLLLIPPEYLRKPMIAVAISSTICCFTLFFWSLARGHGGGPLVGPEGFELIGVTPATGSNLGWMVIYLLTASLGGICAGILNQSDYTRFAVRPRDAFLSQAICTPVVGTLTSIIGIVCTSVAAEYYPDAGLLWTPYELLTTIQQNGGKGARAAVFFASLCFTLAQLGINIPGNLVAGGIDLASLWPKYLNIRRGAYITLAISIAMCPWVLINGAATFLSVMSGYAVFLGPITGLMVFDYFFVHNRKLKLTSLYDCSPNSIYYYYKGCNWRAFVAWACGVGPCFPGFLASVDTSIVVPLAVKHLYYMCWLLGFFISGIVYIVLCKIFPLTGIDEVDEYDVFGTFGEPEAPLAAINEKEEGVVDVVPVSPLEFVRE